MESISADFENSRRPLAISSGVLPNRVSIGFFGSAIRSPFVMRCYRPTLDLRQTPPTGLSWMERNAESSALKAVGMRSSTLRDPSTIARQRVSGSSAYGEQPLLTAVQPRPALRIGLLVFARTHRGFNPLAALPGAIAVQSKSAPDTTGCDRRATRSASRSPSCAKRMDAVPQPHPYSESRASKAFRRAASGSAEPAHLDRCLDSRLRLVPEDDEINGLRSDYSAMRRPGIGGCSLGPNRVIASMRRTRERYAHTVPSLGEASMVPVPGCLLRTAPIERVSSRSNPAGRTEAHRRSNIDGGVNSRPAVPEAECNRPVRCRNRSHMRPATRSWYLLFRSFPDDAGSSVRRRFVRPRSLQRPCLHSASPR